MNKKVLSAILFSALFAGTGTFTSCIDNDEPAGIEELRGAKAELIRAKVAVEQAQASMILAQAEVEKAKAAKQNALAEIEKANAEYQKLMNELQATQNEATKAELEAALETAKQDAELAALTHQKNMLEAQNALAEAQRSHELLMKQIEIAKALMSEEDKLTIAKLQTIVEDKQGDVDDAADALKVAEDALYNATKNLDIESVAWLPLKELDLKYAKVDLEKAEEHLAKMENYMENLDSKDWLAEVKAIETKMDSLAKEIKKIEVEKAKEMNSPEAKAVADALEAAKEAMGEEVDTLDNHLTFAEAVSDTLMYFDGKWDEVVEFKAESDKKEAIERLAGENYLTWDEDFKTKLADKFEAESLIAELNAEIASYTTETKFWLDSIAADSKKSEATLKEASDKAIKAWSDAKTAYEGGKTLSTDALSKAETGALAVFNKAMGEAGEDAVKKSKAYAAFADAIVKYYNELPAAQVGVASISLKVAGKDTYSTKSITTWLSDADYKDTYMEAVLAYFGKGNEKALWTKTTVEKEVAEEGKEPTTRLNGAFTKWVEKEVEDPQYTTEEKEGKTVYTAKSLLGSLQIASLLAFGDAGQYITIDNVTKQNGYLHTQPTADDVKAVDALYQNTGEYGRYLASLDKDAQDVAQNYEAIIADLQAAVTKWTALVNEIVAEVEAACGDIADAKVAVDDAQEAYDDFDKAINEKYDLELKALNADNKALGKIKDALANYLNNDLENKNYSELEEWLTTQVKDAEKAVLTEKKNVAAAEYAVKEAQEGKWDAAKELAEVKEKLEMATADLEKAQAELAEAQANLKTALEIMAATAE